MPTMIFRVTIQGNVPYSTSQSYAAVPTVSGHGGQSFTSCRDVNVVTDTIRDAIALATSALKPTEVITNVYCLTDEVIVDSSCIPRG